MAEQKKAAKERRLTAHAQVEVEGGVVLHLQPGDAVPEGATADSVKTLEDLKFLSSDDDFLADNT